MLKTILLLVAITLTSLSFLITCDTTEPNKANIILQFDDASCTEAWITVKTNNLRIPNNIFLFVNEELKEEINLITADTLLYVDSLLPNKTYNIKITSNKQLETSNKIQFTTLDTTSHNFTWQTFTFGEIASSNLYDVAIIDENNIWAVGEIYMNDAFGNPDPMPYNVAHWDGSNWEFKKIVVTYNDNETIAPLKGIFVLPTGEIIFSSGLPYLPQGNGWKLYHLWDMGVLDQNDGSVDRIWGASFNDLYFVGNKGTIVHYQNGNWTKIESGTETYISDIWGISNHKKIVYCTVSSLFIQPGKNDIKILKITETNKVEEVNWEVNRLVNTIWTSNDIVKYAGGDGLFVNKMGKWKEIVLPTIYSTSLIRGTELNNIIIVGSYGLAAHFNGIDWKIYEELHIPSGYYVSVAFKDKEIAMVGKSGSKGIIVIGVQNN